MDLFTDKRTVLTLDAGGTNFVYSALKEGKEVVEPVNRPSHGDHLDHCIASMKEGFREVMAQLKEPAVAISFAFPGPADYPNGIIGNLENLPGFRGGVPLVAILEDAFDIPVYINNDGDLYTYGEALGGFLPEVNRMLAESGNPKRYQNLVGLTLGTGFGAGIFTGGRLLVGDNSLAAEVWLLSSRISPDRNAEEGVSIRSVIRDYCQYAGLTADRDLTPKDIFDIAGGTKAGNSAAALKAFEVMGSHLGDAMANLITLTDGLIVLGGGIAGAARYFMPSVMKSLNGRYEYPPADPMTRLIQRVYDLDDTRDRQAFLARTGREIKVPGSGRIQYYDDQPKSAVGISRLGASRAIALGAFSFALNKLNMA
jgi:glucokinase